MLSDGGEVMTHGKEGLQPFYAMEINALAGDLERAGRTVCHLEVGEPDAPPAPKVREAVRAVLDDPQKYTHFAGLPALREGLRQYYETQHRVSVTSESIIAIFPSMNAANEQTKRKKLRDQCNCARLMVFEENTGHEARHLQRGRC